MDFYLWKGNKAPEGFSQFTVRKLRGEPQVFQGDAVFPSDYYDVYNDHYGYDDNDDYDDYDDYNYYAVLALRSRFRDQCPNMVPKKAQFASQVPKLFDWS